MKNTITRIDAMNSAINLAETHAEDTAIIETLIRIRDQLAKRSERSDEAKAKASEKRKAQTAAKRAELCSQVVPILREVITADMTAKEIFSAAQERLPQDFTAAKVQNILRREMKDELVKTETKGKANTYRLA